MQSLNWRPRDLGITYDDWHEGDDCEDPGCWMGQGGRHPHQRCECSPGEFQRPCIAYHDVAFDDVHELEADKFNLVALADGWFAVMELDFGWSCLKEVRPKGVPAAWQYKLVSKPMRYETATRRLEEIIAEDERRERTRRRRLMPRVRRLRQRKEQEVATA